jgi:hypothetical protein
VSVKRILGNDANADGSTAIVRTSNQPIQLPNASLYQLNPSATANYLIW